MYILQEVEIGEHLDGVIKIETRLCIGINVRLWQIIPKSTRKNLIDCAPGHVLMAVNHFEMYKLQYKLQNVYHSLRSVNTNCTCPMCLSLNF